MFGGKFLTVNAKIRKENRFKLNNTTFHFKKLDKKGQIKCSKQKKGNKYKSRHQWNRHCKENSKATFGSLKK